MSSPWKSKSSISKTNVASPGIWKGIEDFWMNTRWRPLEGSQHCRSHSGTWWRAWPPPPPSSLTLRCPSLWSPCDHVCTSQFGMKVKSLFGGLVCTSLLPMLNENCSPRSRDESNLDLRIESDLSRSAGGLIGLPVSEGAGVVDVHLVPRPWLPFPLPLHLHKSRG